MRLGTMASARRASWAKTLPAIIALTLAIPAGQHAPARAQAPVGSFSSDNVEYLSTIEVGGSTEGSRLIGNHLFVTDNMRGLVIYDVTDPEHPVVAGEANVPHVTENEDIATNGSIALLSQGWIASFAVRGESVSALNVIDVSDRTAPVVIATIPGAGDHTYECLFDCRWAYGALAGHIVDLRDPARPQIVGNWKEEIGLPYPTLTHDTTEVAPGRVLVAGNGQIYYLDTTDPLHPRSLARSESVANAYLHTVLWPDSDTGKGKGKGKGQKRGDLIFSSTESVGPTAHCSVNDALTFNHFRTWDATTWKRTGTFELIDEYGPSNGMLTDGDPPVSAHGTYFSNNGCSSHWFEPHPDYNDNGLVALAAYSHGMKLLRVSPEGEIEEVGHYLPQSGDAGAAYWITDEILYTLLPDRGVIDILRYTDGAQT